MTTYRRSYVYGVLSVFTLAAAIGGCQLFGGSSGGGAGGSGDDNGPEGPIGDPVPECIAEGAGGGATPTAEIVFPPEGAVLEGGEVTFVWSVADANGDDVQVTVVISDQPDVLGNPLITAITCAGPNTDFGTTTVEIPEDGEYFWGIVVTDGVNRVLRPAGGQGFSFNFTFVEGRTGVSGVAFLCPQQGQPARQQTTFQWLVQNLEPARTQLFVSRDGEASPFDNPLSVFEIQPPTANQLALTEAQALPIGATLTWGLRIESEEGVGFTFDGVAGAPFTVQDNVPPSGELLDPDDGAVWSDALDTFVVSWDADPGNCEDSLTSTIFFEQIEEGGSPDDLFGSELQLVLGPGSLESNLAAANLTLPGGTWAWGVIADDGTDQTPLPNADAPGQNFGTFLRDTAPRFVSGPVVDWTECASGVGLLESLLFEYADDNGAGTVDVRLTYAASEGDVFDDPSAERELDLPVSGTSADAVVVLSQALAECEDFVQGFGFYGVELDDGVNAPVQAVAEYQPTDPPPTSGACCTDDGCLQVSSADCDGIYIGDGSACSEVDCDNLPGACCQPDGSCEEVLEADCDGSFQGNGTSCDSAVCPVLIGACCQPDGSCQEVEEDECTGSFQGTGSTCDDASCPVLVGACCLSNEACIDGVTSGECSQQDGEYQGNGTNCDTVDCVQLVDCNGNGIEDSTDISNGTSADCNTNGIPDECEDIAVNRRYVDDSVEVSGDGLSWETAYATLQEALTEAAGGSVEEIWVAEGTYTPAGPGGDRTATFQMLNGVALYGGFQGDELCVQDRLVEEFVTRLSGDLNNNDFDTNGPGENSGENSFHVVTATGTDATAILDGFTVSNGFAFQLGLRQATNNDAAGMNVGDGSPTVRNCTFEDNYATSRGGAVFIEEGSPQFVDCRFLSNIASNGGAVYTETSSPTFTGCEFTDNEAFSGGGIDLQGGSVQVVGCRFDDNRAIGEGGDGGAIRAQSGTVTGFGTVFNDNSASSNGGGIANSSATVNLTNCDFTANSSFSGAGIDSVEATLVLSSCLFSGNIATSNGGGLATVGDTGSITGCTFANNSTTSGTGTGGGGAYYFSGLPIEACTFVGNSSASDGGGIYMGGSNGQVINSLFNGNNALDGDGGGIYVQFGTPDIVNCTLVANLATGGDATGDGGGIYSDAGTDGVVVTNCIAWNNVDDNDSTALAQIFGAATVTFSCVEGLLPPLGLGNIADNPLFVDQDGADNVPANGDDNLRLSVDSPCIEAGNSAAVPGGITTDLDGNQRIVGATVDMGAYEFPNPPPP